VLARFRGWLDNRTGYRTLLSALLIEHIPGGAKWRYVWGSCLAFVFGIQLVTGVLLMMAYSPGDSTAWGSVYFIQYEMDFGWLIRGLHHFGSQTMVVLLGVHMLQVVIAGAHLSPREVNWWLGLLLMACVLGLSLTGYLLPWDQKGFWATQVATNIMGNLPGVGSWLQKVVVGGPAYGHATLTRFYALHVAILPPLVIVLTALHLAVFRRHGITTPANAEGEGWFWPDQAFRDLLVCLAIFGVMLGLVLYGHGHTVAQPQGDDAPAPSLYEKWAHAGKDGLGANLDAPADPSRKYPARPEWYFLSLFQLLKYFEGKQEVVGTVLIPNGVLLLLAVLPLLGWGWMRKPAHGFAILVVVGLLVGVGALTCLALVEDTVDPIARGLIARIGTILVPATGGVLLFFLALLALSGRGVFHKLVLGLCVLVVGAMLLGSGGLLFAALNNRIPPQVAEFVSQQLTEAEKDPPDIAKSRKFQEEQTEADDLAKRALTLAGRGVPADGAVFLLRRDPQTQGPDLFKANCGACHTHGKDHTSSTPFASDLEGYGTREWVAKLLSGQNPNFFGHSGKFTSMTGWVTRKRLQATRGDSHSLEKVAADFDRIADWLGGHPEKIPAEGDKSEYAVGYQAFERQECTKCHGFAGQEATSAPRGPDLTGYGSADWVRAMLVMPSHPDKYGKRNLMPAFRDLEGVNGHVTRLDLQRTRELQLRDISDDDPDAEKKRKEIEEATRSVHLSDVDRELILRWLLNDDRVVFGGEPILNPTK
jgi:quinol-cytochrome oxidoreductase complex cytochrome b subunit/mono/diheme cytochrome c family protein